MRGSRNLTGRSLLAPLGEPDTHSALRGAVPETGIPFQLPNMRSLRTGECGIMILDNSRNDKKERNEMPKGERKHYDKAFKLNAVYLMLSKTMPPKEIFQMLDVDRQTVYRWVSEFKAHGEAAFDKKAVLPGSEVRRLQKEMADLRMENEILKKAAAYFAERHKSE